VVVAVTAAHFGCSRANGAATNGAGTTRGVAGQGGLPRVGIGAQCSADSDCSSGNCGAVSGLCNVPLHQSCTPQNCDLCLESDGYSSCFRPCTGEQCNGGYCWRSGPRQVNGRLVREEIAAFCYAGRLGEGIGCVSMPGAPNGSPCQTSGDCLSRSCAAGVCKGA
jgi:hypothetical protein